MSKIMWILFLIIAFQFSAFAQQNIIVDCIHGVDYYFMDGEIMDIQFSEIFSEYQVTKLTTDNISWQEIYIDQEVIGEDVYSFTIQMASNPTSEKALYVYAYPLDYRNVWGITGDICNPNSAIVGELYHGLGHIDLPESGEWNIEIEFANPGNYQVKIGCGDLLLESNLHNGTVDLNDYDLLIRLKNDEFFPFFGKYQEYSEVDLMALEEAFDNGLACLNAYNIFNPYIDKPFVHFYSDHSMQVDYSVNFAGKKTLTKPVPKVRGTQWSWLNIPVNSRSDNEIIYEGIYHAPLNLIQFSGSNDFLELTNQSPAVLDNLYLIRYLEDGFYEYSSIDRLDIGESRTLINIVVDTGENLKSIVKQRFYNDAVAAGLFDDEAISFVYDFNWVESMLHRAYDNPKTWFGLYHFGQEIYDQLIPCEIVPYPEEISRNMWVLLSNIDPKKNVEPVSLTQSIENVQPEAHFEMHEYGIVDEYYSLYSGSREDDFFGVILNEWMMTFAEENLHFYSNEIADEIHENVTDFTSEQHLNFVIENYLEEGILFNEMNQEYPVALARKISENGRLIVMGSCFTFDNQPNNNEFLRNCADALMNSNFFSLTEETQLPDNSSLWLQSYPNPFSFSDGLRANITIDFSIPTHSAMTEITVYNLKGQRVKTLLHQPIVAGKHTIHWNGLDENNNEISSGIYFYRMKSDDDDETKKMVIMK